MSTLYEIAEEYRNAFLTLADLDVDDETFDNSIALIEGDLETKAISVGKFVGNLGADIAAIKEAEQKMASRRKVLENKQARVKAYLKGQMESCGMTEISCPYFQIKIKKTPASVVLTWDIANMPDKYTTVRTSISADKNRIKADLKAGIDIPGATLQSGTRIEIK